LTKFSFKSNSLALALAKITKNIDEAIELLQKGEIVAIPTETVYGLAANAFDEDAVLKIFAAKNRPHFNPLILHIGNLNQLQILVEELPNLAIEILAKYSPGPITLLLKKKPIVSDLVTAGSDYVAVRIPNHSLTLELLKRIDFPLAAPSANPSGYVSPTKAIHVEQQLGGKLQLILDGGDCQVGIESTILGFDTGKIIIHRLGNVTPEQLMQDFPDWEVIIANDGKERPTAPGQLKSHYAPSKTCYWGNITELIEKYNGVKLGAIMFRAKTNYIAEDKQIVLAADGKLKTAAKNVFTALRDIESMDCDIILLEELPNQGIGLAINDRLKRASSNN